MPNGDGNGMNQSDIKAAMNERDLQDLKLQMELQKLQNGNSSNSAYDPTVEMYKLETDRLRQENSDTKILNKLEDIQNRLDRLERTRYGNNSQTQVREIEIIKEIEQTNEDVVKEIERTNEDIIKEIEVTNENIGNATATNEEVQALNREIEVLKLQILEMKLKESAEDSAETEALQKEIDVMKQQLEQQEKPVEEEVIEDKKSSKKKKKRKK